MKMCINSTWLSIVLVLFWPLTSMASVIYQWYNEDYNSYAPDTELVNNVLVENVDGEQKAVLSGNATLQYRTLGTSPYFGTHSISFDLGQLSIPDYTKGHNPAIGAITLYSLLTITWYDFKYYGESEEHRYLQIGDWQMEYDVGDNFHFELVFDLWKQSGAPLSTGLSGTLWINEEQIPIVMSIGNSPALSSLTFSTAGRGDDLFALDNFLWTYTPYSVVPEPATVGLLLLGGGVLALRRRKEFGR